ncbi:MAG: PAS domain S-box protein, partial [Hyphomicrobiales bacterium]|nr:PAS domain S-box protein [Hyphomicrobiales bacterium]
MAKISQKPECDAEQASGIVVAAVAAALLCGLCLFAITLQAPAGLSAGLGLIAGLGLARLNALRTAIRARRADSAAQRSSGQLIERLEDSNWELRESLERYRSLVEASGDLVIRRDRDGRLTFVSDAFCHAFGIARADILGTAYRPQVLETHGEVGRERPYDLLLSTVGGARWYSWLDILIRDDRRGIVEVQSVGRDITERK